VKEGNFMKNGKNRLKKGNAAKQDKLRKTTAPAAAAVPKKGKAALREEILKQPSNQEITGSKKKKAACLAIYILVLVTVLFLLWKGGIHLVQTYLK
jgi:hypothetical protein